MGVHPSLKGIDKTKPKRNVLKRYERVELLKQQGKWKESRLPYNLPKTKPEY